MKVSFNENRIIKEKCQINNKDEFDLTIIKPINETDSMIIYIPGLNGNGSLVKYFNYDFFDNYYLISYDQRAQGDNNNKPSRRYKKYLEDLNKIIQYLKSKYEFIKKIYLIGESWGASLCFLFDKYYKNRVDGIIGWNMPYKVIDVSTTKGKQKIINNLKMITTFLFNINTYDTAPFNNNLTNNKILIRIINTIKRKKLNNKVIIAAWLSFKKAWKYLLKNYNSLNYFYIQSMQDILKTDKIIYELKNKTNKIKILDKGYHILTFDDNTNDYLFTLIKRFLNKKN